MRVQDQECVEIWNSSLKCPPKVPAEAAQECARKLLRHHKLRIAVERSRWSSNRNNSSSRSLWNRHLDVGVGLHRKLRRNAVERDTSRSGQAVAQDEDALPHLAGHGHGFNERADAVFQAENRPVATGAWPIESGSVEKAVSGLERGFPEWVVATLEAVELGVHTLGGDLKKSAPVVPVVNAGPVEIAVVGQRDSKDGIACLIVHAESVQHVELVVRCNFEYGPTAIDAAVRGCTKEVSFVILHERGRIRAGSTVNIRVKTEVVEHIETSVAGYLVKVTAPQSSLACRAIELSVDALDYVACAAVYALRQGTE